MLSETAGRTENAASALDIAFRSNVPNKHGCDSTCAARQGQAAGLHTMPTRPWQHVRHAHHDLHATPDNPHAHYHEVVRCRCPTHITGPAEACTNATAAGGARQRPAGRWCRAHLVRVHSVHQRLLHRQRLDAAHVEAVHVVPEIHLLVPAAAAPMPAPPLPAPLGRNAPVFGG